MKVTNKEGRFQFVKNQIVKIDPKLPKYQKLKLQSSVKPKEYQQLQPITPGDDVDEEPNYALIDNGMPITATTKDVDHTLRELIIKMKEDNTLRTYLGSKDAEKFNEAFIKVLVGERNGNTSDLNIPDSRWTFENAHPITSDDSWYNDREMSIHITSSYSNIYRMDVDSDGRKPSLIERITSYFKNKGKEISEKADKKLKEINGLSVIDLFDILHVKKGLEVDLLKRLEGYYKMLENAEANGQTALFDELAQKIFINIYESVLAVHGYNKYIHFSEIEDLQNKCTRVLDIDYISDFGRIIPDNICEQKKACDEMCVFDNYCILYYDPKDTVPAKAKKQNPASPAAKKEAKAKRDPILFGLINHSDKLYYIGSWTDELCDLTIETIADKLGKSSVKEIK